MTPERDACLAPPVGQDQRHKLVGQGAWCGSIACAVAEALFPPQIPTLAWFWRYGIIGMC